MFLSERNVQSYTAALKEERGSLRIVENNDNSIMKELKVVV